MEKVVCGIGVYSHKNNARLWYNRLKDNGFETVIYNCNENDHMEGEGVVQLENIHFGGQYNCFYNDIKKLNAEWGLFIADDIEIDTDNFIKLIRGIKQVVALNNRNIYNIGLYWPSFSKESHNVCPNSFNKDTEVMRVTNRIEGSIFLVNRSIMDLIGEVDYHTWLNGWGIDLLMSYLSWITGKLILVDDRVIVVHPNTPAGYDTSECSRQMEAELKKRTGQGFIDLTKAVNTMFLNYIKEKQDLKK